MTEGERVDETQRGKPATCWIRISQPRTEIPALVYASERVGLLRACETAPPPPSDMRTPTAQPRAILGVKLNLIVRHSRSKV